MATSQSNQAAKLKALQQAFITADKDGDSLLNKQEFKEFVEIGYQKTCPPGMYENLCTHFSRDPSIGIDWSTARQVWLQAQSKSQKAKSPSPPKQQNGTTSSAASQQIKTAFIQCDKDGDGVLNKQEFAEFVKVGFKKPAVPKGMYEQVCGHFKKDVNVGIDWLSVLALWKQSNPNAVPSRNTSSVESSTPKKNKTPPPKKSSNLSRPPNLRRMQTDASGLSTNNNNNRDKPKSRLGKMGNLSPTKSTGNLMGKHRSNNSMSGSGSALTADNLRQLDNRSGYRMPSRDNDEVSNSSDRSYKSTNRRHRRAPSRDRGNNGSFDDGPDASQMVVQMMETKVKNLQNQLKLERTKRKKTEELAQSLLTQNEEYKKQIGDLQQSSTQSRKENKTYRDQIRKFKNQLDDDRQTIKHLQSQCKNVQNERKEAYELLSKIEKQHAMMVKKQKAKHQAEIEKLSTGFLQSLGAEPGKDVAAVVKELRQSNKDLQEKVETLAATLERKNASLLEALQAVDTITNEEEKASIQHQELINLMNSPTNGGVNGMRERLKSLNQRRKSFGLNKQSSISENGGLTGLPRPPKRRNSQVGLNGNGVPKGAHHRPTKTFFKKLGDVDTDDGLNINNAKNGKELQFVSQQLTSDVANKAASIQNLEMANTALMEQMAKMQKKMKDLQKGGPANKNNDNDNNNNAGNNTKHTNDASITDLP